MLEFVTKVTREGTKPDALILTEQEYQAEVQRRLGSNEEGVEKEQP